MGVILEFVVCGVDIREFVVYWVETGQATVADT